MMKLVLILILSMVSSLYGMEAGSTRVRSFSQDILRDEKEKRQELQSMLDNIPKDFTGMSEEVIREHKERRAQYEELLVSHDRTYADAREKIEQFKKRTNGVGTRVSTEPEKKSAAAQHEASELKHSADELRQCEQFAEKYIDLFCRSRAYGELVDEIQNAFGLSEEDADKYLMLFLHKLCDEAYFEIDAMIKNMDKELKHCRGGVVGLIFYSAYDSAWGRSVQEKHRNRLGMAALIKRVGGHCVLESQNSSSVKKFYDLIHEYFARKNDKQARLLLLDMECLYRAENKKLFYTLYLNPRRVILVTVAAIIALGGAYYYWSSNQF